VSLEEKLAKLEAQISTIGDRLILIEEKEIRPLKQRIIAIENIVYKREGRNIQHFPHHLTVEKILMDLDSSLSSKLQVVDENTIRAREYFHHKNDWSTINKLLKQHGFKWVSMGKQSHWSRAK